MNQESPSQELVPLKKRRTRIPDKPNYSLNLWSIMKNCIGKELSKIPMPVSISSVAEGYSTSTLAPTGSRFAGLACKGLTQFHLLFSNHFLAALVVSLCTHNKNVITWTSRPQPAWSGLVSEYHRHLAAAVHVTWALTKTSSIQVQQHSCGKQLWRDVLMCLLFEELQIPTCIKYQLSLFVFLYWAVTSAFTPSLLLFLKGGT